MPAWRVTKLWTNKEIGNYRAYVAKEGPNLYKQALQCTCEDLAIRIVTDFASTNGLPVFFVNGKHDFPDGITPEEYSTVDDFRNEVQTSSAAIDVGRIVNRVQGAADFESTSLRVAKPGDLILLYDPISHVQVVTFVNSTEVKIVQGGLQSSRWLESPNPDSDNYIGDKLRQNSYRYDLKTMKWVYDTGAGFKELYGRLRIWDFAAWNSRMIQYTVKKGDMLFTIAKDVYGVVTPYRLQAVNFAVGGNVDSKGNPRVGLVLYLWR
jgi:LysM domain